MSDGSVRIAGSDLEHGRGEQDGDGLGRLDAGALTAVAHDGDLVRGVDDVPAAPHHEVGGEKRLLARSVRLGLSDEDLAVAPDAGDGPARKGVRVLGEPRFRGLRPGRQCRDGPAGEGVVKRVGGAADFGAFGHGGQERGAVYVHAPAPVSAGRTARNDARRGARRPRAALAGPGELRRTC